MMPLSVFACLLYCVSFFSYVMHAALTAPRRAASDPFFVDRYRFMLVYVRPGCWWWMLLHLIYSFMAYLLQSLFGARLSLVLLIVLQMVFIAIELAVQPYKYPTNCAVDVVLKASLLAIMTICLSFLGDTEEELRYDFAIGAAA